MTVIKAKTVEDAKKLFGEERVNLIFSLIEKKSPHLVVYELKDEETKKCLIFLFPDVKYNETF